LGVASGYAPGQIKICICLQAIPQAIYSTIFDLRGPRRRLRLCPRANKNLHIPAGYAESILLHNQGDMQIFICIQATPRAFPQLSVLLLLQVPHFCNSILTSSLFHYSPLTSISNYAFHSLELRLILPRYHSLYTYLHYIPFY
ncbi:hypothetical protein T06_6871, partial [Trichinella sp. T6]